MKKRHLATMTAMVLAGALLAGCSSGTAATEAAKAPQSSQAGTEKGLKIRRLPIPRTAAGLPK